MISCIKEIMELAFNASNGIAITRINPKEIIIKEEIRINHLVIGSNSMSKKQITNIVFLLSLCLYNCYKSCVFMFF